MPTYYTEADGKIENLVRERLSAMGWGVNLTDVSSRWDIEAYKGGISLVIEVKRRFMDWGRYPTIFIDKSKVDAMRRRSIELNGQSILVIVPNDMIPRFVSLGYVSAWRTNRADVRPERGDRSDQGDLKYEIPVEEFRPLSSL